MASGGRPAAAAADTALRPTFAPWEAAARSFVAAASATAVTTCFSNPFEVAKTRFQLQGELGHSTGRKYNSLLSSLRGMIAEEGIRGLQAGLAPAILFQVAMNGTRLGSFHTVQSSIEQLLLAMQPATAGDDRSAANRTAAAMTSRFLAGLSCGVLGAVIAHPLYLVKSRLQSQSPVFQARQSFQYRGMWDGLQTIFRQERGVRGLFRGVEAAAARVGAGSALQLTSYHTWKEVFEDRLPWLQGTALHIAASLAASVITCAGMTPFDVVTTRYMQASDGIYSSPVDCFRKTVRAEGLLGLYKGFFALYMRLGPHTVLTFVFLEQFRRLLGLV